MDEQFAPNIAQGQEHFEIEGRSVPAADPLDHFMLCKRGAQPPQKLNGKCALAMEKCNLHLYPFNCVHGRCWALTSDAGARREL
jgi:hypothetical protein